MDRCTILCNGNDVSSILEPMAILGIIEHLPAYAHRLDVGDLR
jgi:hypothetical protein